MPLSYSEHWGYELPPQGRPIGARVGAGDDVVEEVKYDVSHLSGMAPGDALRAIVTAQAAPGASRGRASANAGKEPVEDDGFIANPTYSQARWRPLGSLHPCPSHVSRELA